MRPVKQQDPYGCGIACVASLINIGYREARELISSGLYKANSRGFICKEIVEVLNNCGLSYQYNYIKKRHLKKIYNKGTIVFIKRSARYPFGHYLLRTEQLWMDPWINFPDRTIKAGFRKRFPGKAIYMIHTRLLSLQSF